MVPKRLPYTGGKFHLPYPAGIYRVLGFTDIMMEGTNNANEEGVLIRLLYPAEHQTINLEETHSSWPLWYPHEKYKAAYSSLQGPKLSPVLRAIQYFSGDHYIPILQNVKPHPNKFPVIVFSHGNASNRTTYSNICNQLASNGYIIAVIEHRDGSACTTPRPSSEKNNFDWIPFRSQVEFEGDQQFERRLDQIRIRVKEIMKTLDVLDCLNCGKPINNILIQESSKGFNLEDFQGKLDMENIIAAGHSFGGASVIFALKEESRFKLGICLDAWMYTLRDFKAEDVSQPLIFINMDNFQSESSLKKMKLFMRSSGNENDVKRENTPDRQVLTIKGSRHTDLSDFPLLILSFQNWITAAINWIVPLLSEANPYTVHEATVSISLEFIKIHNQKGSEAELSDLSTTAVDGLIIEKGLL